MRAKRLLKTGVSMVMTFVIAAGLVINPASLMKADASASATDKVFFNAALETENSFRSDVVYENLSGNTGMNLSTPADAYITPEGYLQINYKSSTSASNDGSYTVWGEGGEGSGGDSQFIIITLKATEADYASQFSVTFYCAGANVGTYNFDEWLASAGYSPTEIASAANGFVTYSVPITKDSAGNYQGMKLKFNRGNSRGTLYIDKIWFSNGTVFDDFTYSTARNSYYIDADSNLPMYRPSTSLNGARAGHNYAGNMMWSASTMQANIVNNTNSGERALQIDYDTNVKSYATLSSTNMVNGEPLLALTLKGSASANNSMSVKLMNGNTVVDTLTMADFTTTAGGATAASIGSAYTTMYAPIAAGVSFNSVRFEFGGSDLSGQVFVKDIYFPRYSYTVEHYFDGVINSEKTETYSDLKYGASMNGGYTDYSDTVYSVNDVVYSNTAKTVTGNSDSIKVYYVSDVDYTINYYYDGIIDNDKTVTGSDALGTPISWTAKPITGYKLDSASAESIILGTGTNEINVYYVKDDFGYTIEYYYDGVIDNDKTVTDTATYQSTVGYTDKNITGYKFDHATAETITISEIAANNIIKVYYVKDSFDYTVEYYYDNNIDTGKTEVGRLPYQTVVSYIDKNIAGYKLDKAEPESIAISADYWENYIRVYYVKDSFPYTINYYYDGVIDNDKTVTGTALYNSTIGYTDKNITGYKFDSASAESITISEIAANNVINVYYVKDSFPYTINYYYDGIIDNDKTVSDTALYKSTVAYTDKNITGYKLESASAESITISEVAANNVINVYYVKDSFGYTIEYYYDGIIDNDKTVTGTAEYQSTVGYTDKNINGYEFVSASPASLTISEIEESNVIRVYYAKDSFPYTINYYYDGIIDNDKTINGSAAFEAVVGYEDKNITGYMLESVSSETITISEIAANNVINVYYVKDSFPYTINYYYDGIIDGSKTVEDLALYQSTVGYTDMNITGYKFDSVSSETITISEIAANNVINVYYVKDSFPYTINYYYDGIIDENKTVEDTALYQSAVGYTDKNITGYKLDSVSAESITISEIAANNVINVYYVKDSFPYTINYYYDGIIDNDKTVSDTALYQSTVGYTDKNITGYRFAGATAESITISEIASNNVINVYYLKDTFAFSINYYYDGIKNEDQSISSIAFYQDWIGYIDKNIPGYRFDRATSDHIIICEDETKNVIDIYYVKDSFPYTINYYYDGIIDETKTEEDTALYQSEIGYEDKNIPGYRFDTVSAESIIISEQADDNVIDVYYVKDSFPYTINYYYDGVLDEELIEEGSALYLSEVGYTDNIKEGYELDSVDPEGGTINISYDVEENIINVYYVKYSVDYTIEYYYDNVIDDSLTVKDSGLYGDTVAYKPQLKDGYKFVKASAEKITLGDGENIIKVYYEKIPVIIPETGDNMPIAVPLVTMMICLLVTGTTCVVRRRSR